uniref:Uncharacterized protein n=1 Tax=Mycena chlorophos TaxID=658473 RepID=A0ABQ0LW87_MYCCL|nr:predicted protein [Mycena chlorophos]
MFDLLNCNPYNAALPSATSNRLRALTIGPPNSGQSHSTLNALAHPLNMSQPMPVEVVLWRRPRRRVLARQGPLGGALLPHHLVNAPAMATPFIRQPGKRNEKKSYMKGRAVYVEESAQLFKSDEF